MGGMQGEKLGIAHSFSNAIFTCERILKARYLYRLLVINKLLFIAIKRLLILILILIIKLWKL